MNILHLLDIPWWSALAHYAFDSMEAQLKLGHHVTLAAPIGTLPYRKAQGLGWKVIPIGSRTSIHFFPNLLKTFLLYPGRPNLLVAHTGSAHSLAAILSKVWRVPILRIRTTSQDFNPNPFSLALYKKSCGIIISSKNLKEKIQKKAPYLDKKLAVLYPCVESRKSPPNHSNHPPKVGLLARLDPIKGHLYFLQAAKRIQEEIPDAEFHFAGAEENISWGELLKEIEKLQIKNCFYHGFLKEGEVFPWMSQCDVGVIASIGSEELSRAALEWMAAGVPVVATKVGSLPELIEENQNGFIEEPKDSQTVAARCLQILKSKELREKLSQNNIKKCQGKFSFDNFQNEWGKILEKVQTR